MGWMMLNFSSSEMISFLWYLIYVLAKAHSSFLSKQKRSYDFMIKYVPFARIRLISRVVRWLRFFLNQQAL